MENLQDTAIWHRGKAYRKGYTTGSCATAAAKVAATMLLTQQIQHQVSIQTPAGVPLRLAVEAPLIEGDAAMAAIRKDGGDDVDATHGMLIHARVCWRADQQISIDGGDGIGRVTRAGIGLDLGLAAINKTPRQTIEAAVREVIGPQRGADVLIFAPDGVERAKQTYNDRLGILGGISIIGTTGIVTPMSEESWKRSLAIELEQKRTEGLRQVILVPGNHGERFVREHLPGHHHQVVTMSNFVGYMLQESQRLQFERVVLAGHLGKLIKVAAGIFHTHSHVADGRLETLVTHLALMGVPHDLLRRVYECTTTEAAMSLIAEHGLDAVYDRLAAKVAQQVAQMLRYARQPLACDVVLFSLDNQLLGANRPLAAIAEDLA
ncbi:MAG: cobalt-precorrin-5B (C(1))-methyltransferase CbiD [Aeromonadaceae bacterium]